MRFFVKDGKKKLKFLEKAKNFFSKRKGASKEGDKNMKILETHDLVLLNPQDCSRGSFHGVRCFVCRLNFDECIEKQIPIMNCTRKNL
jgi:hypothetical protein